MNSGFYRRLAVTNIGKNSRIYLPYIFTGVVSVAMFYIIKSLSVNPGFKQMLGFDTMSVTLRLACWVSGIFIVIFLLYTNSFLIKRRKKEFALFHILGMEKKHVSAVLFWETFYVLLIAAGLGLGLGVALDKLLFMALLRMLGTDIPLGFFISRQVIAITLSLFAAIYLVVYLIDIFQIHAARPIELLRASEMGEREPKAKVFAALLGAAALIAGYDIAVTTENPLTSIPLFFVAVLLVMAGTYLLFTAGSIALLKLLRRNKKFYYRTKHFAAVSGMIYRMKQNAVGLANICILSTMVLVMVSSTVALMIGLEDVQRSRYPMSINVYSSETDDARREALISAIRTASEEAEAEVLEEVEYRYLAFTASEQGDVFSTEASNMMFDWGESLRILCFLSVEDYNRISGDDRSLSKGEVVVFGGREEYRQKRMCVLGRTYRVIKPALKEHLNLPVNGKLSSNIVDTLYVVVPDEAELQSLYEQQKQQYGDMASEIECYYGLETKEPSKDVALYEAICSFRTSAAFAADVECREAEKTSSLAVYGGLFFVGIFLGLLFLLATVLIIYYKQISEGYEDRRRFAIMQQVGMTEREVRDAIHSQVLMVFFLPLITAGVHTAFAFPIVSKLLMMLNLNNTPLYIACLVGCFLVFGVFYITVYSMTAGTYHRIVQSRG